MEAKKDSEGSFPPAMDLNAIEVPAGVDRRAFLMRTAVVGAASVIVGCAPPAPSAPPAASTAAPPAPAPKRECLGRPRRREEGQGAGDDR